MELSEVRERCRRLAARLGPNASISINISHFLSAYAFVMPVVGGKKSETLYANDWEALFAAVERYVAEREKADPDAEYRSWGAAA
jgi:hypothetical protein